MSRLLPILVLLLAGCARDRRPDVVVLLADDLGWDDVSYHADGIATPRIDALAKAGVRLESFYATPICTTSRAALLTGRTPVRLGMVSNLRPRDEGGLPADTLTLAELLRESGYATTLVGKWHLGHARKEQHPNARGFEHFYGHLGGFIDYYTHRRDDVLDWQRDGEALVEDGYSTRLIAREAVRVIRSRDRRPLFLCVAFNAAHIPLQLPPGRSESSLDGEDAKRACFVAMVKELDDAVGEILDALEETGAARDSLVFFASDNGGSAPHGGDNGPLRYGKYGTYEGGIRVPAVLRFPGRLPEGAVFEGLASIEDVFPTVAAAAGAALPANLDGVDLLPRIRGDAPPDREELFFCVRRRDRLRYALRRGRWKLVREVPRGESDVPETTELYDLDLDPDEAHDLAAEHPDTVAELARRLEAWQEAGP